MEQDTIKDFIEQTEILLENLKEQMEKLAIIRDREQSKLDLFKTLLK